MAGTGADRPFVIAHRGFAEEFPENTLLAYAEAARRAPAVEVDVRRCGSGELVAFHDASLDRLTEGSGAVADRDYGALAELSVLDTEESIPLLSEVFETVPSSVDVVLDLKEREVARDAIAIAAGFDNDVLATSFLPDAIAALDDQLVPTGLIVPAPHDGIDAEREARATDAERRASATDAAEQFVETALDLGCAALHPQYELCLETDLVDRARAAGLQVNAWTVASEAVASALVDAGVDGIIADRSGVVERGRQRGRE